MARKPVLITFATLIAVNLETLPANAGGEHQGNSTNLQANMEQKKKKVIELRHGANRPAHECASEPAHDGKSYCYLQYKLER